VAEGTNCHKPATVSGGGKSEISKRLQDMIKYGPVFVPSISEDFDKLDELFNKDYSKVSTDATHPSVIKAKTLLDPSVSLGSIIKLMTPQGSIIKLMTPQAFFPEYFTEEHNLLEFYTEEHNAFEYYTEEHNLFVKTIPTHLLELLAVIKQNYKTEWGADWRSHFHTDAINGDLG
ncbi:hypothetical protein T484DRAFT_1815897, partial [Baffinella frigidus]